MWHELLSVNFCLPQCSKQNTICHKESNVHILAVNYMARHWPNYKNAKGLAPRNLFKKK